MTKKEIFKLSVTTPFTENQIEKLIKEFEISDESCISVLKVSTDLGITFDMLYDCLSQLKKNINK